MGGGLKGQIQGSQALMGELGTKLQTTGTRKTPEKSEAFSMSRLKLCIINNSGKRPRYNRARLQRVLELAVKEAQLDQVTLTILLVGDKESALLHGQHFNEPTTTDVMTFPDGSENPATNVVHLGDLAVCVDVASRLAELRGRPVGEELTLYCLHGLLHLLGFDDTNAKMLAKMWAAQVRLLAREGITIESTPTAL
jgi:probable rRNA maturation factor